jgi:hypothetical protein
VVLGVGMQALFVRLRFNSHLPMSVIVAHTRHRHALRGDLGFRARWPGSTAGSSSPPKASARRRTTVLPGNPAAGHARRAVGRGAGLRHLAGRGGADALRRRAEPAHAGPPDVFLLRENISPAIASAAFIIIVGTALVALALLALRRRRS